MSTSGSARLSQGILNSAAEGLMRYVRHAASPDRDLLANGLFDMGALGEVPPESDTLMVCTMHAGQLGICLTGWQKKHTMAAFFVSRWHGPRRNKA